MIKDIVCMFLVAAGVFIASSGVILLGIYWTHYPYGRKGRKKWRKR